MNNSSAFTNVKIKKLTGRQRQPVSQQRSILPENTTLTIHQMQSNYSFGRIIGVWDHLLTEIYLQYKLSRRLLVKSYKLYSQLNHIIKGCKCYLIDQQLTLIIRIFRDSMKSIQETYQKKTPLEHVLLRPDTYVGSIQMERSKKWVLPKNVKQFEYRDITFVPALYKIFDEVLVNAADNYQRDRKMNLLKVQISQEQGSISVHNNGKGIPVEIHKQFNIYVPELIFGHLLTGSNYNDNEKKVVGGRNGYGAKLANIFSEKFIVECGDQKKGLKFKMVWRKNMTRHDEAEVTKFSGKDFTCIKFFPEFSRFGMEGLDDDIFSLLTKRVYDMAGLMPKVKVILNGDEIEVNSFLKYVNMYYDPDTQIPKIRDNQVDNQRWQVVVSISEGQFRQVSFVNSICTTKGGTHVNYITEQIVDKIIEKINKKDKNLSVKPFQVKAHLWIFVNALIQNPTFDSQTKQTMTLKASQFGSQCTLSDKMIKQILKSGIVDDVYNQAKAKQLSKLAKVTAGTKKARIQGIPKLDDANEAGTKNSQKCTLILTEGDSAKALAMAGLQVIGRDFYGVFPLKGKLLNVRQAKNKALMENEEIQNLLKILGLQINKQYTDLKSLRYGAIMIMSDQDTDGSHIKGLVINFIHHFWPSLFKMAGFLKQFITPLLKVTKGRQSVSFFTVQDYKIWMENMEDLKGWKTKYYKGLGTSTDKEAQEYFSDLRKHKIDFKYIDNEDDDSMELIFSKKAIERRKQWLGNYDPNAMMVYDRPSVRYKQFVDRQFIHFSNEDNIRSIASIIDGFKPGQRKIIYGCFKRNLKEEIKVAQLAGYVAEHSAYHHGEMSLTQTIVGMAQNFVGSNNINLLMPNGQFGSRNAGGKDHASARYIFTCLSKITRYIFPENDDHVLNYVEDDGQLVQPQYYMPIIPMGLINGCSGIGTGWSTTVPNFNPREIAQLILNKLQKGEEFPNIHPWYKGFIGEIIQRPDKKYEIKGILQIDHQSSVINIKQLPIGKWVKDYKQFLQAMIEKDERIIGFRQYHTKNRVHFHVQVKEQMLQKFTDIEYYERIFKINGSLSMKNMVGFNQEKKLHRYNFVSEVLEEFYKIRLSYYQKRKDYMVSRLQRELEILTMKERFIVQVVEEKLIIRNKKKIKLCDQLKEKGFKKFSDLPKIKSTKKHLIKGKKGEEDPIQDEEDKEEQGQNTRKKDSTTEYNYLLNMPLWNLTFEKVEEIKRQKKEKENQLAVLDSTQLSQLWKMDLVDFLKVLDEVQKEQQEQLQKAQKNVKHDGKTMKPRKKAERGVKKEKKGGPINWDSESQQSQMKKGGKKAQKQKTSSIQKQKKNKKGKKKDDDVSRSKDNKKKRGEGKKNKDKDSSNSQPEDFMSRMKKKYQEKLSSKKDSPSQKIESGIFTRPKKETKTIQEFDADIGSDYEVVRIIKPSYSKKKANVLDSDDDEEEEFSVDQQSDYSDQ